MIVKFKVHTNSSQERVKQLTCSLFEVWIKEKAIDGKANKYLEKFLKKYFKRNCRIRSGFRSNIKLIEFD